MRGLSIPAAIMVAPGVHGHTKDLDDFETVKAFLAYLRDKRIKVSTLQEIQTKCRRQAPLGEHASCNSD